MLESAMPVPSGKVRIVSLGNAGFLVEGESFCAVIDPFFEESPRRVPPLEKLLPKRVDAFLFTHGHWDHFNPEAAAETAGKHGSVIIGPADVARKLAARKFDETRLVPLEPMLQGSCLQKQLPAFTVTAFRTFHGPAHNSYLVNAGAFRFFHDGDNENTRCLEAKLLGGIDALMLCPWQGSGWVDFIETVRPRKWFLMHLAEAELESQEQGRFLPELCDHVPMAPVSLRPGEAYTLSVQ